MSEIVLRPHGARWCEAKTGAPSGCFPFRPAQLLLRRAFDRTSRMVMPLCGLIAMHCGPYSSRLICDKKREACL